MFLFVLPDCIIFVGTILDFRYPVSFVMLLPPSESFDKETVK